MRLLVAGGGTGGHLFPGLALGEEVKTRHPRNDVLFVGSARGIEAREVPKAGYPLQIIDVGPLKRMGLIGFFRGLFRLPIALWQSIRILKKFDPDVVVGVGGYASGPVVLAAWLLRIPIAVQEQNALPGFTNKILGRFADAVFIAFEEARKSFPARKTHLLGNPIRRAFLDNYLHTKAPGEQLSIFVTGGSQGAHVLNMRVAEAIEIEQGEHQLVIRSRVCKLGLQVVRQRAAVREAGERVGLGLLPTEAEQSLIFAVDAPQAFLFEGRVRLVVPFPFAADDHQTVNAHSLVDAGAAIVIAEKELTAQRLADEIKALEADRARLQKMSRASGLLGRPEAAREIADVCVSLCSARLVREGRHLPVARK